MGRHAYLIMAHGNPEILNRLLALLEHPDNDLYLHIDAKWRDFDAEKTLAGAPKHALIERKRIAWGGYSQIDCELRLLKAALPGKYEYYHLISGIDLPLRSQNAIHAFFDAHAGREFVHFGASAPQKRRAMYYRPLQEYRRASRAVEFIESCSVGLQRLANVDRLRGKEIELGYGSNWFSVTDALARYVVSREDWIRETFRMTACCDEVFLQTLALHSPFAEKLYHPARDGSCLGNLRYIDWKRGKNGSPHTYRIEDYDAIMGSGCLFARKFDWATDREIVERVCAAVKDENRANP